MNHKIISLLILFSLIHSLGFSQTIQEVEYFLDQDPGFGNGLSLNIVPGDTVNYLDSITLTGIQPGFHQLCFRARDAGQRYGLSTCRKIYVFDPSPPDNTPTNAGPIVAAEYFLDQDPGGGLGIPIPITPGDTVISNPTLDFTGYPQGDYLLGIRVRDSLGNWSYVMHDSISICTSFSPKANFSGIQVGSTVTFIDSSLEAQTYLWDFGDGFTDTVANPTHQFDTVGLIPVKLFAGNECGVDSFVQTVALEGVTDYTPKTGGLGDVTINFFGAGFTDSTKVWLEDSSGQVVFADSLGMASEGVLNALFDLRFSPMGTYTVKVGLADTTMVFVNGFKLLSPVKTIFTTVLGRTAMRSNFPSFYTILIQNVGNVDAVGVPLWIAITPGAELTTTKEVIYPPDTLAFPLDSVPEYVFVDSLGGTKYSADVYAFFIPYVPAKSTVSFPILVKTLGFGAFGILEWTTPPLYGSPLSFEQVECYKALIESVVSLSPQTACIYGALNLAFTPALEAIFRPERLTDDPNKYVANYLLGLTSVTLDCMSATNPLSSTLRFVQKSLEFKSKIESTLGCVDALLPPRDPEGEDFDIDIVNSFDPNEKYGPVGVASSHFLQPAGIWGYQVSFENVDTASAAAQIVRVIDTLDKAVYDLSTFQFGPITIGDSILPFTPATSSWSVTYDMSPQQPILLRINAVLDTATGIANWTFTSLDPITMQLTPDPFAGFLPPNVNAPEGEGSVSYSVALKDSLPHLTKVQNKAAIYFDFNEPIITNTWTNTLDLIPPQSSILPLPDTTFDTTFVVSWAGTDDGSGPGFYNVYVKSELDTAFQLWIRETDTTSATFQGTWNREYAFYVEATDRVGNKEVKSPQLETSTLVYPKATSLDNFADQGFSLYPNPASTTLHIKGPIEQLDRITFYNLNGQKVLDQAVIGSQVKIANLIPGAYLVTLQSREAEIMLKQMLIKR
ncbi:MAG: T9SS type A sorting domain-containing protein [Bacteroidota bacterium]